MKIFYSNTLLLLAMTSFLIGCATPERPNLNRESIPSVNDVCAEASRRNAQTESQATNQNVERIEVSANPQDVATLIARGWESSMEGDRKKTVRLFDLALERVDNIWPKTRIEWSYGWAMYNLKDHACALARFEEARKSATDKPRWVPHTFAVTWWQLGKRDLAIDWYDEAVRVDPDCWREIRTAGQCSQRWQRQEKQALAELLAARRMRQFANKDDAKPEQSPK